MTGNFSTALLYGDLFRIFLLSLTSPRPASRLSINDSRFLPHPLLTTTQQQDQTLDIVGCRPQKAATMMKTGVMRQARVYRVALQAATRVRIVPRTLPSALSALSSTPKALAAPSINSLASLARYYSSEAAASNEQDQQPKLVTKFAGLADLGVNPRIVSSITQGMGYEDMTPVQSRTIEAALNGTDL